jgi:hypothetical protein
VCSILVSSLRNRENRVKNLLKILLINVIETLLTEVMRVRVVNVFSVGCKVLEEGSASFVRSLWSSSFP